jgi:hypothetical protein
MGYTVEFEGANRFETFDWGHSFGTLCLGTLRHSMKRWAFCGYATEKNRGTKIKTNETCLRKISKLFCTLPRIIVKNAF